MKITDLKELGSFNGTIHCRVIRKRPMRKFNQGHILSVDLTDESGEIRAVAFNNEATRMDQLLGVDQVYRIGKFLLQTKRRQHSQSPHDLEILFEPRSVVIPIPDDGSLPRKKYHFVELRSVLGLELKSFVDVIGVVLFTGELEEYMHEDDGQTSDMRFVTLVDQSGFTIKARLWDRLARDFDGSNHPVLAFGSIVISPPTNKHGPSRFLDTKVQTSILPENPNFPETRTLRKWFSANKDDLLTEDSRMDDSNIPSSSSGVEDIRRSIIDAVPPGPTAPRTGMDEKIGSALDIVGVPEYRMGFITQMPILGSVLRMEAKADAILAKGDPEIQLRDILKHYIAEKSPTWHDFCKALNWFSSFNNVRAKIEADHSSADKPTEHDTARITPVEEMTFSANKDDLPTEDSGMDDSNISKSSSDVEDIQSQVKDALKNGSVKVEVVKSVFLGPPGVGKTQLKRALLGDFREVKESTNVSTQAAPAVEVLVADTTHKKWEQFGFSHLSKLSMDKNSLSDKQWSSSADTYGQHPGTHRSTSEDSQVTSSSQSPIRSTKLSVAVEKDTYESRCKLFEKINSYILTFITEAKAKRGSKEPLEFKLVYIIDNGGQPSFLDFHSVTATFAASYVLLFDARKEGLAAFPEITLRKTKSKFCIEENLPPSIYSNFDLLRRSLMTVHHFSHRFNEKHKMIESLMKDTFHPAESPHVLIVGTHKDDSLEPKRLDDEARLDRTCKSIPLLKHRYDIHFVDSLNQGSEDLSNIRKTLSLKDNVCKFDLPLSWFQVYLLSLNVGSDESLQVQKYADLRKMCLQENHVKSPEEFRAMITVMHCLGVFCIPELELGHKDLSNVLVFFDPNLLFGYLSQILTIPFYEPSSISCHVLRELQNLGELTPDCLAELDIPDTLGTLPGFHNKLLGWLVNWRLAANLKKDGENRWFIPSVLPPRPKTSPPFVPSGSFRDVFPLYFTVQPVSEKKKATSLPEGTTSNRSFHYLPAGFFPHLVVHLMQTGCFWLPENSTKDKTECPCRCRDSIVLEERDDHNSKQYTLNICLVDESDRLAVHMEPDNPAFVSDPSALYRAGTILEDLKKYMIQTNERLFCTSSGNIALCSACRCDPASSPQSSSQAVQPALIHLAKVGFVDRKFWQQCLKCSSSGVSKRRNVDDDSLIKVLLGFSGQALDSPRTRKRGMVERIHSEPSPSKTRVPQPKRSATDPSQAQRLRRRESAEDSPKTRKRGVGERSHSEASPSKTKLPRTSLRRSATDSSQAEQLHRQECTQDLKSTGSVESETVDTLPDIPIAKLETTPIAGREITQQLLDKYKDSFKSDHNSQSALQRSKIDDNIIPSPVCSFEVEALRTLPLEKDLREISDNCGDSWKRLLTYVGLKSTKIQEFKTDEDTLPDACFQGLVYWLGGNVDDSDPVNWSTLLTAMKKADLAGNGREWKQKIVERCAASLDKPRDAGQSGNDETSTPRPEEAN